LFRLSLTLLCSLISVAYCPLGHDLSAVLFVSQADHVALNCTPPGAFSHCDRDGSIGPPCCAERPLRVAKRRLRYA